MAKSELDQLLESMPAIAEAVEKFSSESIQSQVFHALITAFQTGDSNRHDKPAKPAKLTSKDTVDGSGQDGSGAKPAPARKTGTGKAKQTFSIDKQLDMRAGSTSLKDFATEKRPTSAPEKVLIAVYWLTRVLGSGEPATLDRVYTCFKHMNWVIPADLANASQQAGARGWLDSRKRDDLKVVVGGENHVEHEMPAESKS